MLHHSISGCSASYAIDAVAKAKPNLQGDQKRLDAKTSEFPVLEVHISQSHCFFERLGIRCSCINNEAEQVRHTKTRARCRVLECEVEELEWPQVYVQA